MSDAFPLLLTPRSALQASTITQGARVYGINGTSWQATRCDTARSANAQLEAEFAVGRLAAALLAGGQTLLLQ
jgi:hypothetical protein